MVKVIIKAIIKAIINKIVKAIIKAHNLSRIIIIMASKEAVDLEETEENYKPQY
jgi:hypothetical protein